MVSERNKARFTALWNGALLYRLSEGKKFPKTPEELWGEKPAEGGMTEDALLSIAKSLDRADQLDKVQSKRKRSSGTVLREE